MIFLEAGEAWPKKSGQDSRATVLMQMNEPIAGTADHDHRGHGPEQ
jgi:hypothetical protein